MNWYIWRALQTGAVFAFIIGILAGAFLGHQYEVSALCIGAILGIAYAVYDWIRRRH